MIIEGVDDLVTFEGHSVEELVSSFEEAVEDYIGVSLNKLVEDAIKKYFEDKSAGSAAEGI